MTRIWMVTAVSLLALLSTWSVAQELQPKRPEKAHSVLMQNKLKYSQQILAGLAQEDFNEIAKNASVLKTFAGMEEWFRADTPEYRSHLKSFRSVNEQLIRLAQEKNLEGATLAYMQLTLGCVNCHSHIRHNSK